MRGILDAMLTKDFAHLPHTDDERLQAAYSALKALDKLPPSVDALAKLTGVDEARVRAWLAVRELHRPSCQNVL